MPAAEPCPIDPTRSLAALRMEAGALAGIVERMRADDLHRPTRLGDWTVQQLVAHLVRGVDRIGAYLRAPAPGAAEVDWLGYWGAARQADPVAISRRAREFMAEINDRPVLRVWHETTGAAIAVAESEPPDRLLQCPFGGIRLDHYLPTRVLEVTVHGLDLRAALGLEEVASPYALEVTTAVLDGLLDRARPDDLTDDPIGFVLAATGRRNHDDPGLPVIT